MNDCIMDGTERVQTRCRILSLRKRSRALNALEEDTVGSSGQ